MSKEVLHKTFRSLASERVLGGVPRLFRFNVEGRAQIAQRGRIINQDVKKSWIIEAFLPRLEQYVRAATHTCYPSSDGHNG